jgi:hypothetical protein
MSGFQKRVQIQSAKAQVSQWVLCDGASDITRLMLTIIFSATAWDNRHLQRAHCERDLQRRDIKSAKPIDRKADSFQRDAFSLANKKAGKNAGLWY